MRFAKWLFLLSGIWGLLIITPMFFSEQRMNDDFPPPITHAEYYYGFAGAALGYQIMYLMIARDPLRYRMLMPLGAACKLCFFAAVVILHLQQRCAPAMVALASPDAVMAVLFMIAWWRLPKNY